MTNSVIVGLKGEFVAVDSIPLKDNKVLNRMVLLVGNDSVTVVIPDDKLKTLPSFNRLDTVLLNVSASAFKDKNGNAQLGLRLESVAPSPAAKTK